MTITVKDSFNHGRHKWLGMVNRDEQLTPSALRVAVLLWELMNAKYECAWPSLIYIANELSMDKSTVTRSIKLLEERGWIQVERRTGCHRSNQYRIAFGAFDMALDIDDNLGGCGAALNGLQDDNKRDAVPHSYNCSNPG